MKFRKNLILNACWISIILCVARFAHQQSNGNSLAKRHSWTSIFNSHADKTSVYSLVSKDANFISSKDDVDIYKVNNQASNKQNERDSNNYT